MLIYKYKIPISDATEICLELPKGARVLCVVPQENGPMDTEKRWFFIVLTDQEAVNLPERPY